jgi:lipopolysaccharide biosynthesis glycosyltransferase
MNVVYHSSNGFVDITGVSIISLLENNKDMENIRIFYINRDITDENKAVLSDMVSNYGATIEFVAMPNWSEKFNIRLSTTLKRWLGFGYNRLFITELLPDDIERVIYLDSDTVIEGSLKEIWEMDFEDCYEAAVDDCLSKKYRKMVHLAKDGIYCNSGMLMLNLEKFRKDNVVQKFLNFIAEHKGFFVYNEQTILNSVFENKIKILPLKYNVYTLVYELEYKQLMKLRTPYNYSYSEDDYNEAKNNPVITHYTGCFLTNQRPWVEGSKHPHVDMFLKYKALTPWASEPLRKCNSSVFDKIVEKSIVILPKSVVITVARILYNDFRPILFDIRRKKHLKGLK